MNLFLFDADSAIFLNAKKLSYTGVLARTSLIIISNVLAARPLWRPDRTATALNCLILLLIGS